MNTGISRTHPDLQDSTEEDSRLDSSCECESEALYCLTNAAGVAKLVYALDSKSSEVTLMSVRVRPPAPVLPLSAIIVKHR